MYFAYHKEYLLRLLKRLGSLTYVQVQQYLSLMTGESLEEIAHVLKIMEEREIITVSSTVVGIERYPVMNRKMIISFWIYLKHIKEAKERYFKAEYPATLGFVSDEVYVITVCDNPKYDKDMIALKAAAQNGNTKNIIAGVNFSLEEMAKDMHPASDDIFIQVSIKDILTDIPEIKEFEGAERT